MVTAGTRPTRSPPPPESPLLRRAGIGLADIGRFLASPSATTLDEWLAAIEADSSERRRALTELAHSLGLRRPARKEPLVAITIRSVGTLDELADAFDLAGAQFDPAIDRTDERRFADLRTAFPAQRDLLLVAEADGTAIGAALGFTTDGRGVTLRILGITPSSRRQGVGRELLRSFERGVRRLGAETISLGADETVGFYVRQGYRTMLMLQWVYDTTSYEAEATTLLTGPLSGMEHHRASFNNVPQLFVVLDEPDPSIRAQVSDLVTGAHVGYCMTRRVATAPAGTPGG